MFTSTKTLSNGRLSIMVFEGSAPYIGFESANTSRGRKWIADQLKDFGLAL